MKNEVIEFSINGQKQSAAVDPGSRIRAFLSGGFLIDIKEDRIVVIDRESGRKRKIPFDEIFT